ncbi:MAG: cysteine hydrolase family protein [Bacteroidota bacterium]
MKLFIHHPALIVIDVQHGIDDAAHWGGNRNNPDAEQNIEKLLTRWRRRGLPVFIVQHQSTEAGSPFRPGQKGNALKEFATPLPGETLISKSTTNAFISTGLQEKLEEMKIKELVIAGFVTNNSVESTARRAGELGFKSYVVSDATACFDKVGLNGERYASALVHDLSLANLKGKYAFIATTKEIINSIAD